MGDPDEPALSMWVDFIVEEDLDCPECGGHSTECECGDCEDERRKKEMANVRPDFEESLRRYVEDHRPPGGFLRACLENDFLEAVARYDRYSPEPYAELRAIAAWIYFEAPSECHGSPEKVKAWLSAKPAEGEAA